MAQIEHVTRVLRECAEYISDHLPEIILRSKERLRGQIPLQRAGIPVDLQSLLGARHLIEAHCLDTDLFDLQKV